MPAATTTSAAPAARAARAVRLSPASPWPVALRALVEECLAQVQGNEQGVVDGDDAEHVHQMRVGLRRLRAALGLFKGLASPPETVLAELRASARCLGEARDAEVLLRETLARLPAPPLAQALAEGANVWPTLLAAAQAEAEAARRAAARAVRSHRHVGWQLALMAWVSGLGGLEDARVAAVTGRDRPEARTVAAVPEGTVAAGSADLPPSLPEIARHRLRRLRKRLMALGQRLGRPRGEPDPATCHAVRIAAKKLRYATEMIGELEQAHRGRHAAGGTRCAPSPARAAARALAALQQELGVLNDAQIAAARLQALSQRDPSLGSAAGYALGWLACDAQRRAQRLGKPWRRVRDAMRAARR